MQLISLTPEQKADHKQWIAHFTSTYGFKFFPPTYERVPHVSRFYDDPKISERVSTLEYYLI